MGPEPMPRRRSALRALLLLVPLAAALAVLAVLYLSVDCLDCDGLRPPQRPQVVLSSPVEVPDGFAFEVVSVSLVNPASSYRIAFRANDSSSTAVPLGSMMNFTVGGETYAVSWTDDGVGGTLTAGDRFRVARTGGLSPNTVYTVLLLWNDASILRTAEYRTA